MVTIERQQRQVANALHLSAIFKKQATLDHQRLLGVLAYHYKQ